jgi:multiple sugar transport system ATP-binding protein
MYSLEVSGLTKHFGQTPVLKDVSFSVLPGESFAILGPEDSGKTTLLRLLSGLEVCDQGRILINGVDITHTPSFERSIAVVLQNRYGLLPHLDVNENLSMSLHAGSVAKKGLMRERVLFAAQTLHVQHLLERKISTLSDGDQLRVALARGLVKRPQLYLLDESLMQLDTPTRLAVRRELVAFQRTSQLPFVYMTRDQPEAFALADRVAVIHDGEIQQIGTRAELFYTPATLWVAQWLGFPPMNTITGYLQGTYQPDGMHYRIWAKSMAPLLPVQWTSVLSNLQNPDIIVGIRPEDILPEWELAEKWLPSFCAVKVEVMASEWNQGKTLAQLQLPHTEDRFMAVFDIPHDQVKIGQVLTVAFDPERFCLFHPRTEKLLYAPSFTTGLRRNAGNPISRPLWQNYRLDRPK